MTDQTILALVEVIGCKPHEVTQSPAPSAWQPMTDEEISAFVRKVTGARYGA